MVDNGDVADAGTEVVVLISSSPEVLAHHSLADSGKDEFPFASLPPNPCVYLPDIALQPLACWTFTSVNTRRYLRRKKSITKDKFPFVYH